MHPVRPRAAMAEIRRALMLLATGAGGQQRELVCGDAGCGGGAPVRAGASGAAPRGARRASDARPTAPCASVCASAALGGVATASVRAPVAAAPVTPGLVASQPRSVQVRPRARVVLAAAASPAGGRAGVAWG